MATLLDDQFAAASEFVQSNDIKVTLTDNEVLQLEALYKQAVLGPCTSQPPSFWDFRGRRRWKAWKSLANMPTRDAMKQYIELVEKIVSRLSPELASEFSTQMDQIERSHSQQEVQQQNKQQSDDNSAANSESHELPSHSVCDNAQVDTASESESHLSVSKESVVDAELANFSNKYKLIMDDLNSMKARLNDQRNLIASLESNISHYEESIAERQRDELDAVEAQYTRGLQEALQQLEQFVMQEQTRRQLLAKRLESSFNEIEERCDSIASALKHMNSSSRSPYLFYVSLLLLPLAFALKAYTANK